MEMNEINITEITHFMLLYKRMITNLRSLIKQVIETDMSIITILSTKEAFITFYIIFT